MKIAQEKLLKSRKKYKTLYDKRARRREFQEGAKFHKTVIFRTLFYSFYIKVTCFY